MNPISQPIGESLRILLAAGIGGMLLLSGCATTKTASSERTARETRSEQTPRTVGEAIQQARPLPPVPKAVGVEYKELVVNGVKLKNTRFDYPVTINGRVEHWVDYFTGRGREHFEKYLERSEFFIPYILPILKENGVPEDLVYLAMIESGFNNFAKSHAKAVGPWQFISATGKRYGLMVNWWVDERRDIRKSTLSAVEYLKDLYGMFQSWELAAASYNAGENKVARAVQRYGTKDFWVLSKYKFLRQETRDYVPKIIAAAIIAKNRTQFGFPESRNLPHPGADEAVAGDGHIVKLEKTDKPEEKLDKSEKISDLLADLQDEENVDEEGEPSGKSLTPSTLLIQGEGTASEGQVVANDPMPLAKPVPTPHLSRDGKNIEGAQLVEFDVRSPADLLKVARAAGLSYQTVKSLNPELLRWCTPPSVGAYRVRLPAAVKEKFLVTYNHVAFPRQVKFMTYKIRKGETLQHVARHFGIKVDPISDLNGVSPKMRLRQGVHVMLPIPNDRSRSLASLEVRDPPEKRRGRKSRRGRAYRVSAKNRGAAKAYTLRDDQG